ncbi:MAG: hypothetical protein WDM85_13500 [Caulobacteraceae bacterium]
MARTAVLARNTKEGRRVRVAVDLDGTGEAHVLHRHRLLRPHCWRASPATAAST